MPIPHHSSFLQAGCPSCRPTNSVNALKAGTKKESFHSINFITSLISKFKLVVPPAARTVGGDDLSICLCCVRGVLVNFVVFINFLYALL